MSLDAIGLVSKDLSQTIRFYKILGITMKSEGEGDHWEGETPSGVRIMADSIELIKKLYPDWVEPTGKAVVLCFKQGSAEGVDSVYSEIMEAGFSSIKEPWDAFWGQRYASVQDPDGNQIDIFADL